MHCEENKTSAAFIERVNDKWLLYKVTAAQYYHHFLPLLDEDERAKLDDVLEFAATMGGPEAMGGLTWDNLVCRAQHANIARKLAPEQAKMHTRITGFGPTKVAEPSARVASVALMMTKAMNRLGNRRLVGAYSSHFQAEMQEADRVMINQPRRPCELCSLFPDRKGHANSHMLATCFTNPLSKQCKPGVARMRMQALKEIDFKD